MFTIVASPDIILPILASPRLRPEHCDKLRDLLVEHEAKSLPHFAEGTKQEYVMMRTLMRDLLERPEAVKAALGGKPGSSLVATIVNHVRRVNPDNKEPPTDPDLPAWKINDKDLAQTPPVHVRNVERRFNRFFSDYLALQGLPAVEREKHIPDYKVLSADGTTFSLAATSLLPGTQKCLEPDARFRATLLGALCLVALRRWQLTRKAPPTDLGAILKAARLNAVPIDPYDGKPLRFAVVEGQPVIYSIGIDGHDDGGRVDSENSTRPGDLIFQLSQPRSGQH